jgi:hypothetical protein
MLTCNCHRLLLLLHYPRRFECELRTMVPSDFELVVLAPQVRAGACEQQLHLQYHTASM